MPDRREVQANLAKLAGFVPEKSRTTYDPNRFYLRSSDSRGHSKSMRFDISPADRAMMSELMATNQFPYRSFADILRDAVHHRCHYLLDPKNFRGLVPEILDNLSRKEIEEIVESRARNLKFYGQMKSKIRGIVSQLEQADFPAWEVAEMLDEIRAHAERLREPYRGKLLAFLVEAGASVGLRIVEDPSEDNTEDDEN